jgi:HSP20 family molecular chaperone IbpA
MQYFAPKDWLDMVDAILNENIVKPKLPDVFCSSSFPPSNVYTKKDNLVVELACAGYDPKNIEVEYKDSYIFIKSTSPSTSTMEDKQWIQKGIKRTDFHVKYFLHEKYDEKSISAEFSNGLLILTIKPKEDKPPIKVKVN